MLMRLGTTLFILPSILLLILYGIELSAITSCQELGLFYHATLKECVEQQPAFSSFYMRNTVLVNSMLGLAAVGAFGMTTAMLNKHR